MEFFRCVLALLAFFLGCYLIYDLIVNGFNWSVLVGVFVSYVRANYLWPRNRKQKDSLENSLDFVDLLEFVITLPFRAIALFLRTIGRVGKEADNLDI